MKAVDKQQQKNNFINFKSTKDNKKNVISKIKFNSVISITVQGHPSIDFKFLRICEIICD